MAPSINLTVKVHPVVYMAIIDAYERKSSSNIGKTVSTTTMSAQRQERVESRALGTLLGFYEKNVVQATNCYAIPFSDVGTDTPEINDNFNRSMWQMCKRSSPTEQIVGWFFTVPNLPDSCFHYNTYYSQLMAHEATKKELQPVILLTMDLTFSGSTANRLPVKAFTMREGAFCPLNVEMDAFLGEAVALNFITRGIDSERREIELGDEQEQLLECTENVLTWLERIMRYVKNVLNGKDEDANPEIGRKLMEIVELANTQLPAARLESLSKHSLRDYLMVSLLANLAKTQLSIQEKLVTG
ncbi:hypothetical protein ACQ4LE_008081 [Meloidogyne hapla]|uniref:JAB_MPN domain-containing protein n=1 Tax=Meloidogyne hapla TaxID=6305 RepID=A0A1I8BLN7_MELHA